MARMKWNTSYKLDCTVQDYAWGMKGEQAYISNLLGRPADETPKAELWMGAHIKASSLLGGVSLLELIQNEPEAILGPDSYEKWGKMLPYLFKILSANEALSIQLHPNKQEAEMLHAKDPEHYPDDNHKPEIAIALDQLEALVGFEPFNQLVEDLNNYPEIVSFLGADVMTQLNLATTHNDDTKLQALKTAFMALNLSALSKKTELKILSKSLFDNLNTLEETTPKEKWYLELYPKYSEGDVGLFAIFFLNYCVLEEGQAVFLKADVPHAYLRGNIIECMANSDNVVRAGLTPKFVDVENLAAITQYELEPLPVQTANDNGLGGKVFQTPVQEFEVHIFEAHQVTETFDLSQWSTGAAIGILLEGNASFEGESISYKKGEVMLIPNSANLQLNLKPSSKIAFAKPNLK